MAASPVFIGTPKITPVSILPADTTTKKTVCTAGSGGSKVVGIVVTSTDTSNRVVQLYLNRSSTDYLLGAYNVQTLSGSDGGTGSQNLLQIVSGLPRDNDGQPYLFLESGDVLKVATTTTVTTAKEIDVVCVFGNF